MIKKIALLLLLLLNFQACGDEEQKQTEKKVTQTTNQSIKKKKEEKVMTHAEIFGEEPIYKLRVKLTNDTTDVAIVAKVNGVKVYDSFRNANVQNLLTVNDLIVNENNSMSMMLMAKQNSLSSKLKATITLEVFAEGRHYILNHLTVDMSKKERTTDSTKVGHYDYLQNGLMADAKGKIVVGEISSEKFNFYREGKTDGLNVIQNFSLPTPYPRWKFLDSADIIESTYDYLNNEAYETLKNTPKIKELYAIDAKIRKALLDKEPERIIDLFDERNRDISIAGYDDFSSLKKGFLNNLTEYANNPNCTLLHFSKEDHYFVIEENKKIAWLKPIEFYNKETRLYHTYTIRYRLNSKGEWVITR